MDKYYKALGIFLLLLVIAVSFSGSNSRLYEGSIVNLNIKADDESNQIALTREMAVRLVMEKANYPVAVNLKAAAIDYGITAVDFWQKRKSEQITNLELAELIESAFITEVDLSFFGLSNNGNLRFGEAELLLDYFVQRHLFITKRTLARALTEYDLIEPEACLKNVASDLFKDDLDCEFINGAIKIGLFTKIGDSISPDKRYNRAEVAKLIVELLEIPIVGASPSKLKLDNKWYEPYFATLVDQGLIELGNDEQLLPYADTTSWYLKNILARIE